MEKAKLANAVSAAGPSLLEKLWEELDSVMDRLYAEAKPEIYGPISKDPDGTIAGSKEDMDWLADNLISYGETRGQAQGLAFAIATITNPYKTDVPAVKAQAAARLRNRLEDDE